MENFYIRKITEDKTDEVIRDIGFDKDYINKAFLKYKFIRLKIHNLTAPQANILKQLCLSIGADSAVHRDVITCKVEKSDVLLGCTYAQLIILAQKLKSQPFNLSYLADQLLEQIQDYIPKILKIRDKEFDWSKKTYIMGILNLTPDSFSDGGQFFTFDAALNRVKEMIDAEVDIIDIGGESTRPGSKEVEPEEELKRIIPVIKEIRKFNSAIPVSVDTRHSIVAREAIANGADIINDVSGFDFDPEMINVVADLQVPVIIMHSLGTPETMQVNPTYEENIVDAVYKSLSNKIQNAVDAGIKRENIIIDPGIGFGKTIDNNLEIIHRIGEFKSLLQPVLVGVSRKSFISKLAEIPTCETEIINVGIGAYLVSNSVNIIRVHDVEAHVKAFKVLDKIIRN